MIALLLILIPLVTGLAAFLIKSNSGPRNWALLSSLLTLIVSIASVSWYDHPDLLSFHATWLPELGSSFSFTLDGMSKMLCLLTSLSMPLIIISTYKNQYSKPWNFYGLMLLM